MGASGSLACIHPVVPPTTFPPCLFPPYSLQPGKNLARNSPLEDFFPGCRRLGKGVLPTQSALTGPSGGSHGPIPMATSVGNTPSGLARPASPRSSHPLPSDFLGTFARRARKFPDQPRNSQAKVSLGKGTAQKAKIFKSIFKATVSPPYTAVYTSIHEGARTREMARLLRAALTWVCADMKKKQVVLKVFWILYSTLSLSLTPYR